MILVRSIAYSVLASVFATIAVRRILAAYEPVGGSNSGRPHSSWGVVVVVPMFAGNSNNRIGYVKEINHHHHHSLFGRGRR